ncbi:hypothetical protein [Frigoribacterium salinisoli]
MTNTRSRLLALPTAIALALGGLAVATATAPANAEPAPRTTSTPGPAPTEPAPGAGASSGAADEEGPEVVPAPSEPGAEVEGEQAPTQPAPLDQAPVVGPPVDLEVVDGVAEPEAEAEPDADADADAAEPLVLTSPVAGEVRRDLELRIEGESPGAESVEFVTSDPRVHGGQVGGAPRFAFRAELPSDVASSLTVTVRSVDAAGAELGRAERTVTIDVPTSPPVVVTSPATGSVLAADVVDRGPGSAPTTPDWGWFRVTGTGVPGQYLDLDLRALDLESDHGTDGVPVQVRADGRWTLDIARPFGTWRVSVAQYGLTDVREEDGYLLGTATTRLSPATSIDVRLVPAQAAPPVVAPVEPVAAVAPAAPTPTTTLVPTARPASSRPALASTGSADGAGDALLVGLLLAGVGSATLALARRRAPARRGQEATGR